MKTDEILNPDHSFYTAEIQTKHTIEEAKAIAGGRSRGLVHQRG
jgi:hypothetical protein